MQKYIIYQKIHHLSSHGMDGRMDNDSYTFVSFTSYRFSHLLSSSDILNEIKVNVATITLIAAKWPACAVTWIRSCSFEFGSNKRYGENALHQFKIIPGSSKMKNEISLVVIHACASGVPWLFSFSSHSLVPSLTSLKISGLIITVSPRRLKRSKTLRLIRNSGADSTSSIGGVTGVSCSRKPRGRRLRGTLFIRFIRRHQSFLWLWRTSADLCASILSTPSSELSISNLNQITTCYKKKKETQNQFPPIFLKKCQKQVHEREGIDLPNRVEMVKMQRETLFSSKGKWNSNVQLIHPFFC